MDNSIQVRLVTVEDEHVCEICAQADHKLKNQPIYTEKGGWNGQTWGQRFGETPFHSGCRCQTISERANTLANETEADYLEYKGKYVEAAEIRYKMALQSFGEYPTIALSHGIIFAKLGEKKRAWEIFVEGVQFAVNKKESPHQIREAMADFFIQEGETKQAAGILLLGIQEAENFNRKGVPKSILNSFKKTVKSLGLKEQAKLDEIINVCKIKGAKNAFELLGTFLQDK